MEATKLLIFWCAYIEPRHKGQADFELLMRDYYSTVSNSLHDSENLEAYAAILCTSTHARLTLHLATKGHLFLCVQKAKAEGTVGGHCSLLFAEGK